ncbi:MAG: molybdopterin cofactor-binding domain-containing protein, partial [Bacteroidota bacterium]
AFGQKLVSFDAEKAKSMKGVVDVVPFGDKVAVLANSTWEAMQAKKQLTAEWKDDSKLESTKDHNKILIDLLNGKKFKTLRSDGNVKKAFTEADRVLERVYESPFIPHNCLEPMNFFANVTDEKVELVGPVQTPEGTAKRIAKELDRDFEDISLEMTRMGGGFGRRLYGDFAIEAAHISNIIRKPVQVIYSREDDMEAGIYRPAIKYKFSAAIKGNKITGYHLKEAAMNNNMYGLIPNFFPAGAIENYQVDVASYKSNITTGAWRAPYTNFLAFAEQSFFDELAELMKVDRVQLRLDLLQKVKGTTDERIQYSPERMEEVIKTAVKRSKWGNVGKDTYQGFSAYYCHNTHVAEVADVVMESGKPVVKKVTCVADCGIVINPLGAKNQMEGGVIDGIGHAMYGELNFLNGIPQSNNFHNYRMIRMNETPEVETFFIENDLSPTGLGEPALPPAAGAVANAIKAATGVRLTKQPFINNKEVFG